MNQREAKETQAAPTNQVLPETLEEDALEEGTELGSIRIHNNVIALIARTAALRVKGVVEMAGGLVDGLAGILGKRSGDRGIRIDVQDNCVQIELHVILDFGARIPQVAWQLQNDVRRTVEQMTGKTVKAVHVIVQSVRIEQVSENDNDTREETTA